MKFKIYRIDVLLIFIRFL